MGCAVQAGAANRCQIPLPKLDLSFPHHASCRWVYQDGRRNNIPTWHSGEE